MLGVSIIRLGLYSVWRLYNRFGGCKLCVKTLNAFKVSKLHSLENPYYVLLGVTLLEAPQFSEGINYT